MSLINVTNLTFAYDGSYDNIFENVSFQIDTDWKLGFAGRNGRGKTTFLNLLLKKYQYSGNISSNVDFEYFPYVVEDKEQLTIEIIDSICSDYQPWKLKKELNQLQVTDDVLYRQFSTLSNGEQTKVLIAALFLKENNFLLIDEPTNHLDQSARKIVSDYLNSKKGYILVSHDRDFIDNCIDHILVINKSNIEVQKGNFSSWWENKQARDSFEISENNKLKKDIKHLTTAAKATAEWSDKAEKRKIGFDPVKTEKSTGRRAYEGAKSKKMMSRSTAIKVRQQTAIEEKSKLLNNIETVENLKISPLMYYTDCLVKYDNISISYDERTVCKDVTFNIMQGDRIALCGKNGCGKSSIIKLICQSDIAYTGKLIKNNRLKVSYVSQETDSLCGNLSEYAEKYGIDESLFKAILRKLDFSRVQFEKSISDFSGGQKKKVMIARSLCEQAHLYVWDEPLNFIDVFSRMQIEELILKYKPTLLFVEHDSTFCDNVATKKVIL